MIISTFYCMSQAIFKSRYDSILFDLGIGDKHGGKTSNLSKFDGELGPLELLAKQIFDDMEAAAEKKEADDPKKKLNELETECWKVTQSKPLRVKSVKGDIKDNSVSKLDRQSKSLDSVRLYLYLFSL